MLLFLKNSFLVADGLPTCTMTATAFWEIHKWKQKNKITCASTTFTPGKTYNGKLFVHHTVLCKGFRWVSGSVWLFLVFLWFWHYSYIDHKSLYCVKGTEPKKVYLRKLTFVDASALWIPYITFVKSEHEALKTLQ